MKKIKNGLFIVLEGGEGSGKTTLQNRLAKYFTDNDYKVVLTREPGGSVKTCEELRYIATNEDIPTLPQFLILSASREINTRETIIPALKDGSIVICDRYALSSIIYQGIVQGLSIDIIKYITDMVTYGITPDIEIVLDIDPHIGLNRVINRNGEVNAIDKKDIEYHKKVNEAYLNNTYKAKNRFIINASEDQDHVYKEAINKINMVINCINS